MQPMDKNEARAQAAASKAYAKSQRNWFARHKILTGLIGLIALFVVAGIAGSKGSGSSTASTVTEGTSGPASSAASTAPSSASSAAAPAAPAVSYPGQKDDDKVGTIGGPMDLSGWTVTTTKLIRTTALGPVLCSTVAYTNRSERQQDYTSYSWTLQLPSGLVEHTTFTGDNGDLDSAAAAPQGRVSGRVCFDDKTPAAGTYVLSWTPGYVSSERGVWLNKL